MDDWLTEQELTAWVRLVGVMELLPPSLDSHMRREAELTRFEYYVLAILSEAPERTLRMTALATRTNATLPRLSHVVRRLGERGLTERLPSRDDRRATDARLTPAGWAKVRATAPGHVARVRELVFDVLTPDQVTQLADIARALLVGLDPGGVISPATARLDDPR